MTNWPIFSYTCLTNTRVSSPCSPLSRVSLTRSSLWTTSSPSTGAPTVAWTKCRNSGLPDYLRHLLLSSHKFNREYFEIWDQQKTRMRWWLRASIRMASARARPRFIELIIRPQPRQQLAIHWNMDRT